MKTSLKAICAIWFLLLITGWAQSSTAQRWTLTEVIARVRQQHPLLVAARQRVAVAEAEQVEAGLRLNPSLTFSGENFPLGSTTNGFRFDRSIDWFATYSQTFETGNKRQLRQEMADRHLAAVRAEADTLERQLIYDVKAAYQHLIMARLRAELLRENQNNLHQLVGLNEVRVREGYTAEGDLIKVKLETQRVEYQLRKAELDAERAKINLLKAMGASSYEPVDLAFTIAEELDYQPVSLNAVSLQDAALRLPQVQAANLRVERAQALLRLEQARTRPDITATFGYKRNGADNAMYGALNIPLPIFNRNQAQIARANAEIETAQAELRYAKNQVLADLASARSAVELNQKQVEGLRTDFLMRADEARSVSLAAYREGAVDLLVLLDAQRVRAQAQEFYFQALYDYQLAIHELERAAGIERLPRLTPAVQTASEK